MALGFRSDFNKIFDAETVAMMEEIKARIAEGRWEVTATDWVETDKNMPSGESLLRHIEYTREYLTKVWVGAIFCTEKLLVKRG